MSAERWPVVALSGHRDLGAAASWATEEIDRIAAKLVSRHGAEVAICGMALGADTTWALAALGHGMQLWAYVPFHGQEDRWSLAEQDQYLRLRGAANQEHVFANPGRQAYLDRNDAMVKDCDLLVAVIDPGRERSGTGYTLRRAQRTRKPTIIVDLVARSSRLVVPARADA